jgi:hypothetical protein
MVCCFTSAQVSLSQHALRANTEVIDCNFPGNVTGRDCFINIYSVSRDKKPVKGIPVRKLRKISNVQIGKHKQEVDPKQ